MFSLSNLGDAAYFVPLLGLLIPLLTAFLTKLFASARVKAVVTLVLSAIASSTTYLIAADGHHYNFNGFISAFLGVFVPAIASYYGFWKPTGAAPAIAASTPNFGVGAPIAVLPTTPGHDAGYTTLGNIGFFLLVIAVVLLVLTLVKVFIVSIAAIVVVGVLGLALLIFGGSRTL